jgi:hypothetical protein
METMNRKSMVILAVAAAAFAQTNSPSGLKVWFGDGTGLDIHTESTGANSPVSTSGSETVPAGRDFHRLIFDKQGALLLGYDIEARKAGQGTFTVRIKPVDTDKIKVGGLGKWLDIPTLSGVREFPPLRTGDAVEVDILYHPVTGERIYDVLKVSGDRPPARVAAEPSGERFSLENVRVAINGKTIVEERNTWMRGGGLMVYLPGRGESYLSLSPSPDFPLQPSGWIDHDILRFFAGNELVEIVGKSNMLQKSDYSTVWVYHMPELELVNRVKDRSVEFACGDNVESLIRMHRKKEN